MATEVTRGKPNIHVIEYNGTTWTNIDRPSLAEMQYLGERYGFHPLELEDCLSKVQIPKLDEHEQYLFLVLHFPLFDKKHRLTVPCQVAIFVGADYVVTVHRGELRPLVKLFSDCQSAEEMRRAKMSRGSGFLLYSILDTLVDYCFPIVSKIISNVDDIEGRIFDAKAQEMIKELAIVRRDLISYRRIIRPQIEVLEALEEKEYPFLKVDPDVYFGDLADHIRRIWVELEELKEVVEGLYDTHNTLTSYHTGEIIRILTIIATIMLPLGVVTGLYGMNVALPLEEHPAAFSIILGVMTLISGGMLAFFRSRRWI